MLIIPCIQGRVDGLPGMMAASALDVAILEVGLGGRLDSTNVLSPIAAGQSISPY